MDDADRALAHINREVEDRLAAIRRENARGVDHGRPAARICSDCPDPIDARRLAARPNATRCLPCQEAVEDRRQTRRFGVAA